MLCVQSKSLWKWFFPPIFDESGKLHPITSFNNFSELDALIHNYTLPPFFRCADRLWSAERGCQEGQNILKMNIKCNIKGINVFWKYNLASIQIVLKEATTYPASIDKGIKQKPLILILCTLQFIIFWTVNWDFTKQIQPKWRQNFEFKVMFNTALKFCQKA